MFAEIEKLKKEGKKIGLTASTSDLGQPGLLIMLEQAKADCDFLIFGLLSDPTIDRPETKNFPVETLFERWIRISSCKYVDMIIPFSTEKDLENMLKIIKPDIRYVGEEYRGIPHTGRDIPGIKIIYNERKHDYSTTQLRERIYKAKNNKE